MNEIIDFHKSRESSNNVDFIVELNRKKYKVNETEFNEKFLGAEYCNLKLIPELKNKEIVVALVNEISSDLNINNFITFNPTHGGYISIECANKIKNNYILNCNNNHKENIEYNLKHHNVQNVKWECTNTNTNDNFIFFSEKASYLDLNDIIKYNYPVLLTSLNSKIVKNYDHYFELANTELYLYISNKDYVLFHKHFHYYLKDDVLNYENLINLCVMVKNGGELFEKMLTENLHLIDKWTILDTGSTDNSVETVKKILVGKKKGKLYQEPFIDFSTSRNRCLDLAGTDCKYLMMLDDTYVIKGNLRKILNIYRCDQKGDSFSLYVKSNDLDYLSNRITVSTRKLRYKYTIHEVITDENNMNFKINRENGYIFDMVAPYMNKRTKDRTDHDLICHYRDMYEYPNESRHLYYMAQKYKGMDEFEKAEKYWKRRIFHKNDGFFDEKSDAVLELARICQYNLNRDWRICEYYYNLFESMEPTRPESAYFLGLYYYNIDDKLIAFNHFKRAFEIGYPYHKQQSLRPTISFVFTPYYLTELCYIFKDFVLGYKSALLYLENNNKTEKYYNLMIDWHKIYNLLNNQLSFKQTVSVVPQKPIFCFVADGGFTKWTGSDILTKGVGGSERWIIEMARYVKKLSSFDVYVFCNCEKNEIFEGVYYNRLTEYVKFISICKIQHCLISRYSEYIPVSVNSYVENIHVVLHDISLSGNVIPFDNKIKTFLCLSEWHKENFLNVFPQFKNITHIIEHGINFDLFKSDQIIDKIPQSFIYSSFPNRGLLNLLKMWPKIQRKYPLATLNIFTDINNVWANENYPEELENVKNLLEIYQDKYPLIKNHGWVDTKTLSDFWKKSDVWLYPCIFQETFCLTALEAAITKTFAITNDLAALNDVVGDGRGVIIKGNSINEDWKEEVFEVICKYLDNPKLKEPYIEKNYLWAINNSWTNIAKQLLDKYIYPYDNTTQN